MDEFKITLDPENYLTKQITCRKRDLFMRVVLEEDAFAPERMIMAANLGNFLDGGKSIYFEILYPKLDENHDKWDMKLFYDACEYFCQVELDQEPTGFELINQQNFYPYEKGDVIY